MNDDELQPDMHDELERRAGRGDRRDPHDVFAAAATAGGTSDSTRRRTMVAAAAGLLVLVGIGSWLTGRGGDDTERVAVDDGGAADIDGPVPTQAPLTATVGDVIDEGAGFGDEFVVGEPSASHLVLGGTPECMWVAHGDRILEVTEWPSSATVDADTVSVGLQGARFGVGDVVAGAVVIAEDHTAESSCTGEGSVRLGQLDEWDARLTGVEVSIVVDPDLPRRNVAPVEVSGTLSAAECLVLTTDDGIVFPLWPAGTWVSSGSGADVVLDTGGAVVGSGDAVTLQGSPLDLRTRTEIFGDLTLAKWYRDLASGAGVLHCPYDRLFVVDQVVAGSGDEHWTEPPTLAAVPLLAPDGERVVVFGPSSRPVIFVFTATWCAPCRDDLANVVAAMDALDNRARVVVVLEQELEVDQALIMLADAGLVPWATVVDRDGQLVEPLGLLGLPGVVITDARGVELDFAIGQDTPIVDMFEAATEGTAATISEGRCEGRNFSYEHDPTWATGFGWDCGWLAPIRATDPMVATGGGYAFDPDVYFEDAGPIRIFHVVGPIDYMGELEDGRTLTFPSGVVRPGATAAEVEAARGAVIESMTLADRTIEVRQSVVGTTGWGYAAPGEVVREWSIIFPDEDNAITIIVAPGLSVSLEAFDVAQAVAENIELAATS